MSLGNYEIITKLLKISISSIFQTQHHLQAGTSEQSNTVDVKSSYKLKRKNTIQQRKSGGLAYFKIAVNFTLLDHSA